MRNKSLDHWEPLAPSEDSGKLAEITRPAGHYFYPAKSFEKYVASNNAMQIDDPLYLVGEEALVLILDGGWVWKGGISTTFLRVIWKDKVGYIDNGAKIEIIRTSYKLCTLI
jgi:hypothetical protein